MPRYRFAWTNLPTPLLRQLGKALGLDGDPADALRYRYGARPRTTFVQEAWPTLLDNWLPTDSAMRQLVAEELRQRGLGRTEISIRSKQGQLDYLRSCRNAPTLREVVLEAFLEIGESPQLETPEVRDLPESIHEPPTIRPSENKVEETSADEHVPLVGEETDVEGLDDWIVATLKEAYGLSEVYRDSDGDIPIPRGSSMLYIRPHDGESPFLEIFSPLLQGFRMSPDVYEAVNALNMRVPMAKATVVGDGTAIILSAHLLVHTLSAAEFLFAIDLLLDAGDHFDTLLQKRFGGSTQITADDDAIEV